MGVVVVSHTSYIWYVWPAEYLALQPYTYITYLLFLILFRPPPERASLLIVVYAVGVWYGLLSMAGFKTATVNPMHWKGDLGLRGLDKDDSRLLARQMVPSKASMLE